MSSKKCGKTKSSLGQERTVQNNENSRLDQCKLSKEISSTKLLNPVIQKDEES